jgi:hypothetical protein
MVTKRVTSGSLVKKDSQTPFDFTQNSLFRHHILKLEAELHLLVVSAHHIIIDGWSMRIILQEIGGYIFS